MHTHHIGIIGSSGKTGQRIYSRLVNMGYSVRGLSRRTSPAFDWNDRRSWPEACKGLNKLYITYQPDLTVPKAEDDIRELIAVAKHAGIRHLVLLSGRGEEGARAAEVHIINSGLTWNVVRASWFMQNFSESFMLDGILNREMVLPQANAKEPFIDVDDIADIVVATLTEKPLRNQLFEITGPELLSFEDCLSRISNAIGEVVEYRPISVNAYIHTAKQHGMPEDIAWLMNELFTNVLDGRNAYTTDTLETILGRRPRSFEDYVTRVAESSLWQGVVGRSNTL